MITGYVDAGLEARIPLYIEDATGQLQPIEVVVDTGFTGFLAVPLALIASLALPWQFQQHVMLGDGSIQLLDVYSAVIIWDTQSRTVHVTAVDPTPLVGMKLLEGSELRIRVRAGDVVLIDDLP
jgi:clan AA aspartic protease